VKLWNIYKEGWHVAPGAMFTMHLAIVGAGLVGVCFVLFLASLVPGWVPLGGIIVLLVVLLVSLSIGSVVDLTRD